MELTQAVSEWLSGPYDEKTKEEIRALTKSDPKALLDAFHEHLSFGTGGMRALMGVGTARMNTYTVQMATQGLASYLLSQSKKPTVLIGFDSRHHSHEFALAAASVLAGNGIQVYLLKELRPTPFISFCCREKKCSAAIMITASHNPKEYNGYKVYWSDGGQVVFPHDAGIEQEANKIHSITQVKTADPSSSLIEAVGEELDAAYFKAIFPLQFHAKENQENGKGLKIVYTSLHGTGITLAPNALREKGFTGIHFVEDQIKPDGDFPTVKFPNPEYPETLQRGIQELIKTHSDLLIATDPDADRMGAAVMHQGKPVILTGNEIAAICTYYLCEILETNGNKPEKKAFVTTIVSTELIQEISKTYGFSCFEVLTGFKYIAEKIHQWETSSQGYQFLFGAEESYGYLLGTVVRDKDGIIASCLIAEIALFAKLHGKTLVDLLSDIHHRFGVYREKQLSLTAKGSEIHTFTKRLRDHPPTLFCNQKVTLFEDYQKGLHGLPKSDVLLFRLLDGSKIIIRPSGTEPKIKIYASTYEKNFASEDIAIETCNKRLDALLENVKVEYQS